MQQNLLMSVGVHFRPNARIMCVCNAIEIKLNLISPHYFSRPCIIHDHPHPKHKQSNEHFFLHSDHLGGLLQHILQNFLYFRIWYVQIPWYWYMCTTATTYISCFTTSVAVFSLLVASLSSCLNFDWTVSFLVSLIAKSFVDNS